ncbi:Nitrilase family, member 2 [Seminavis robusta]|uniref:Nitrilase family, member 2 n=1 Tax=Seminavis robusta TaxID=568900 RepID=A0A9N8HMT6_9STRA|nr:Nitrilase family, member 2 [Seminavis robusta]|eukprot:Sro1148_g246510.1 Nitrilase family, member 2 (320) ;mRNA; r:20624-21583
MKANLDIMDSSRSSRTDDGSLILPIDFVPSDNEVIIGRGKKVNAHVGNKRFRSLVQQETQDYADAQDKAQKTLVVSKVLFEVRRWGGDVKNFGFVKWDRRIKRWIAPKDSVARVAVAQAFRDALGRKSGYASSKDNKQRQRHIEKGYIKVEDSPAEATRPAGRGDDMSPPVDDFGDGKPPARITNTNPSTHGFNQIAQQRLLMPPPAPYQQLPLGQMPFPSSYSIPEPDPFPPAYGDPNQGRASAMPLYPQHNAPDAGQIYDAITAVTGIGTNPEPESDSEFGLEVDDDLLEPIPLKDDKTAFYYKHNNDSEDHGEGHP